MGATVTEVLAGLSRAEVRAFVESHRGALELAQADNRLPQFRLDLRDRFEEACAPFDGERLDKALRTFDEEVEAFCQQLRIGGMVVTNQVERGRPGDQTGRWLAAWALAIVAGFIGFAIAGINNMAMGPGLTLIIAAGALAFWIAKPKAG